MKRASSRTTLKGYVIGVENIRESAKKCQWYKFYVQTEMHDVIPISSFDIRERTRQSLEKFERSKAAVKVVLNIGENNNYKFDEGCDILPITDSSVAFPIRAFTLPSGPTVPVDASIKDVLALPDPKGLVNVEGVVCFGKDPLQPRNCRNQKVAYIKVDCFIEDDTGILKFKIWENTFKLIENQKRYRFTKLSMFDDYKSGRELSTTLNTQFEPVDAEIDVLLLKGPGRIAEVSNITSIDITRFASFRNYTAFYTCVSCQNPIKVAGKVGEELLCTETNCGAISIVEFMTAGRNIEVLVVVDKVQTWLSLPGEVLSSVFDLDTVDDLTESLKRLRDMKVFYDRRTQVVTSLQVKKSA